MSLMVTVRGSLIVTSTHCRFGLIDMTGFAGASRIFTKSAGGDWYVCWPRTGMSGASIRHAVDRTRRYESLIMDLSWGRLTGRCGWAVFTTISTGDVIAVLVSVARS